MHIRVQGQRLAGLGTEAIDHIAHARWPARFDKELRQFQAGQRGLFGGFEHHTVARRQNGCELPYRHQHGVVPRCDGAHHAHRLVRDHVQGRGVGAGDRAFHFVDALSKVANGFKHLGQVDVEHVRDRFAHVHRLQRGQFMAVRLDQVGPLQHDGKARARRLFVPAPIVPRRQTGGHSRINVRRAALGHDRDHLARGGADAVKCLA